jgi:predicted DCC family thiol-disulfide oxidoreductase YuxK
MIPERLAAAGLTPEDALYQVWTVTPNGRVLGGSAAANAALALIWWAWPLTWLYRLPGMRPLQDKLYRWVANNRYRMPGGTAACQIENTHDNELRTPV